MVKCEIEFDNDIASPMSPEQFIRHYVFRDNVHLMKVDDDNTFAEYHVYGVKDGDTKVMTIRMKNIRQE